MQDMDMWQSVITFAVIFSYMKLFSSISYDLDLDKSSIALNFDARVLIEDNIKTGLFFARSAADIRYDAVVYDPRSGVLSIEGLVVERPDGTVRVARIRVSSISEESPEFDVRFEADGVAIAIDDLQLPPQAAQLLAEASGGPIATASFVAETAYDFRISDASVQFSLDIDGLGRVYGVQEATGLHLDTSPSRRTRRSSDPQLRGGLASTIVGFENAGVVELMLKQMGLTDIDEPQARALAASASQQVVQWFEGKDLNPNAPSGLTPAHVQDFATALEDAIVELLLRREGIAVAIEPETPIQIADLQRYERLEREPELRAELLAALAPVVAAKPVRRAKVIADASPAASASLTPAESLEVATALIDGVGAPRNLDVAIEILSERERTPEERLLLVRAFLERGAEGDRKAAFSEALLAAAQNAPGASGLLTRISVDLPVADILSAEEAARPLSAESVQEAALLQRANDGDRSAMRKLAELYETGRYAPRSLGLAYRWATLAAASGDAPAARMRDRLEALFVNGDAADKTAWAAEVSKQSRAAIDAWNDGLSARAAGTAQ